MGAHKESCYCRNENTIYEYISDSNEVFWNFKGQVGF